MDSRRQASVAKILVVGDAATGKTSVIRRYVYKTFQENHQTTIGVDFSLKKIKVDGETLNVQLWDIAGQDRFTALARIYYNHAVAAIVVFDVTERRTLDSAVRWKEDIDEKVFLPNGDHIPVVLFANKYDLLDDGSAGKLSPEEIDQFVKKHHFCGWFNTSAKTGANVKAGCNFIITQVVENSRKMVAQATAVEEPQDTGVVKLGGATDAPGGAGGTGEAAAAGGCCG